ncbi:zinc finger protein CONSTANS-LIKE 1 isoform X1 [Cucumis melo]|uniref:Zinc finger protein CONSTANS-LIKE 1 isoform X1 n=1 Tax=Cucumis melo TaxID=3656 RepID=A0A1S3CK62_CUCME|nr:zinc finger protein CONSTANS-LIKE 1 isoform X1 [Cucumis melo]
MAFSPFLSAASHSSADIAGVDFDHWLPDSSIKLWNSEFSDSCGDGSPPSPPEPLKIHPSTNNFLLHQSFPLLNHDSLQSNNDSFLQRTFSSSLSPPPSAAIDPPINRPLFPAGDFQQKKNNNERGDESPVSCESSITIIEGMSRACRYSPEEKKERIERYRTKRNQRNFNKKIKYACRKSLADSRPRIRGRFARYNDEVVKNYPVQWSHQREEEQQREANSCGDNWIKYFIDTYSANLIP